MMRRTNRFRKGDRLRAVMCQYAANKNSQGFALLFAFRWQVRNSHPLFRSQPQPLGASLAATVSHELFGTGDEKRCAHWAEIGDTSAPFSEWHETSPFETLDACEEARGKLFNAARPGAPENAAQCVASDDPRLKGN